MFIFYDSLFSALSSRLRDAPFSEFDLLFSEDRYFLSGGSFYLSSESLSLYSSCTVSFSCILTLPGLLKKLSPLKTLRADLAASLFSEDWLRVVGPGTEGIEFC